MQETKKQQALQIDNQSYLLQSSKIQEIKSKPIEFPLFWQIIWIALSLIIIIMVFFFTHDEANNAAPSCSSQIITRSNGVVGFYIFALCFALFYKFWQKYVILPSLKSSKMLSSSEGTRKSVFKETVKSCVEYIFLILFYSGVLLVFLAYSEILMMEGPEKQKIQNATNSTNTPNVTAYYQKQQALAQTSTRKLNEIQPYFLLSKCGEGLKITLQGSFIVSVAIILSIFCEYTYIKLKKSN